MRVSFIPQRYYNVGVAWERTLSTVTCEVMHKNIPFWETTSWLLLCWHHVSWLGKQSSLQRSEVSRPFVFRTSRGTDGRQNEWEATSEAGYLSSVPVVSPLTPPPQ